MALYERVVYSANSFSGGWLIQEGEIFKRVAISRAYGILRHLVVILFYNFRYHENLTFNSEIW